MTAFGDYNNELNRIISSFYTHIQHSYMQNYVENPAADRDQATILYILLNDKEYSQHYIHNCILTTLLVQAALDTHETVNSRRLGTEEEITKRQLTVLAGDYYSSLYYYFLSGLGDVSLIRVFARSIQEINESKMNIYNQRKRKIKPSVRDLKTIHASLVRNIANTAGFNNMEQIIEEFFLLKSLLKEREAFLVSGKTGKAFDLFSSAAKLNMIHPGSTYFTDQFNDSISRSLTELQHMQENDNQAAVYIRNRISDLIEEYELKEHCAVEEG